MKVGSENLADIISKRVYSLTSSFLPLSTQHTHYRFSTHYTLPISLIIVLALSLVLTLILGSVLIVLVQSELKYAARYNLRISLA